VGSRFHSCYTTIMLDWVKFYAVDCVAILCRRHGNKFRSEFIISFKLTPLRAAVHFEEQVEARKHAVAMQMLKVKEFGDAAEELGETSYLERIFVFVMSVGIVMGYLEVSISLLMGSFLGAFVLMIVKTIETDFTKMAALYFDESSPRSCFRFLETSICMRWT